jgi:hypothetical protein
MKENISALAYVLTGLHFGEHKKLKISLKTEKGKTEL